MNNDKFPEQKIVPQGKFLKWFDNFWYHYKWQTIGILFIAFVLIIVTVQMANKENPDIVIMYAGTLSTTNVEDESIRSAFNSVMPADYNKDGEKNTQIAKMTIYSEQQIKENQAKGDEGFVPNSGFNAGELQKFDNLIATGEYSICLLDPWLYERVKVANGFSKLSDILGETPEGANDEYSIKLSDTKFAKYFNALDILPEETLLCLRVKGAMSTFLKRNSDVEYSQSVEMFLAIVNFEYPSGYVPEGD